MDTRRRLVSDIAVGLRPLLEESDGFIYIERFERLAQPGKPLSLLLARREGHRQMALSGTTQTGVALIGLGHPEGHL